MRRRPARAGLSSSLIIAIALIRKKAGLHLLITGAITAAETIVPARKVVAVGTGGTIAAGPAAAISAAISPVPACVV
jgi:hypothetical protein